MQHLIWLAIKIPLLVLLAVFAICLWLGMLAALYGLIKQLRKPPTGSEPSVEPTKPVNKDFQ